MFDANTPVDEHTTKTFAIQVRNFFKLGIFDRGSVKRLEAVLREDTAIVEESQPFFLANKERCKKLKSFSKRLRTQNLKNNSSFSLPVL